MEPIKFETILIESTKLPIVNINREEFLRKELQVRYRPEVVEKAIQYNPASAGICLEEINKIAETCIVAEARKAMALSAVAGLPGGWVMAATVPADIVQYYGYILRVLQKLLYLYGWEEIRLGAEELNDEMINIVTLFFGIMFGMKEASDVVNKLSVQISMQIIKKLPRKSLTKGIIYPIIKKILKEIGIKMTKPIYAKAVSKIVPVAGAVISGGMTYYSFTRMAERLRENLASGQLANVEYYKSAASESIIDVEAVDITEDDIW